MSVLADLQKQYKIDHIGVAVHSIAESMEFYKNLGFIDVKTEKVEKDQVEVAFLEFSNQANIELIEASSEDSPIHKFIQKKGPGIHHICIRVSDIVSVLSALKEQGVRLIDLEPRQGAHNCLVAFIHPKSSGGVLIELSQKQN